MKVNFDDAEYALLCRWADYYQTSPAPLVRQWVLERIGIEEASLKEAMRRVGARGGGGDNPTLTIQPPPSPGT